MHYLWHLTQSRVACGRFLDQLIKASEELDVDGFSQCCFDYDQV